jgi:hypothetical protein
VGCLPLESTKRGFELILILNVLCWWILGDGGYMLASDGNNDIIDSKTLAVWEIVNGVGQ